MERRLAAILAADMVGYSRLIEADEAGTIARQRAHRLELIGPKIADYGGRIVKTTGDGMLVEFSSVVGAVQCAVELQTVIAERESEFSEDKRIAYRVGINLGDIIIEGDDILGDGVNVAARLEGLAAPAGVCISDMVYQNISAKLDLDFQDLGEKTLKNIDRRVRVWGWPANGPSPSDRDVAAALNLPPLLEKPSIAILPFDNMSSHTESQFLADGFCEDLTTALSKIDNLAVVSRTASFAYRGKGISALEAGRELGAAYIVEGSVRTAGNRVRINAQLIEGASGNHIWAERFDGSLDHVSEFQDSISEQIVTAAEVHLSDGEQVLNWRKEAGDPRAYEQFLSARAAYKEYSHAGSARARRGYEAALAISPGFAAALVGLARSHIEDATFGWSADKTGSEAEARRLLQAAFEIQPDHAMAQAELGHLLMREGDFEAAREASMRAVALDPNLADAHHVVATTLVCLGGHREALRYVQEAVKLNPGTPEFYFVVMAAAYIGLERYEDAKPILLQIVARRPYWLMAQSFLVIVEMGLGQPEAARRVVDQIQSKSSGFTVARWLRCIDYPNRPDVPKLRQMLLDAGLPE